MKKVFAMVLLIVALMLSLPMSVLAADPPGVDVDVDIWSPGDVGLDVDVNAGGDVDVCIDGVGLDEAIQGAINSYAAGHSNTGSVADLWMWNTVHWLAQNAGMQQSQINLLMDALAKTIITNEIQATEIERQDAVINTLHLKLNEQGDNLSEVRLDAEVWQGRVYSEDARLSQLVGNVKQQTSNLEEWASESTGYQTATLNRVAHLETKLAAKEASDKNVQWAAVGLLGMVIVGGAATTVVSRRRKNNHKTVPPSTRRFR